jgi:hypothetical protein
MTTEQLIEEAGSRRTDNLPLWARYLLLDLAKRLRSLSAETERLREDTAKELEAARALLNEGPADSDTFLSLASGLTTDYDSDDNSDFRPLGKGVRIEFRIPDSEAYEGVTARMTDGSLEVSSLSSLTVRPVNRSTVLITEA